MTRISSFERVVRLAKEVRTSTSVTQLYLLLILQQALLYVRKVANMDKTSREQKKKSDEESYDILGDSLEPPKMLEDLTREELVKELIKYVRTTIREELSAAIERELKAISSKK